MNTITREDLKNRLDKHEPIQLVMALSRLAFDRVHIPGSVDLEDLLGTSGSLSQDREVIIYCTNPSCPASYRAGYLLRSLGFHNVTRYTGGIEDWVDAGYPVEGSMSGAAAWGTA